MVKDQLEYLAMDLYHNGRLKTFDQMGQRDQDRWYKAFALAMIRIMQGQAYTIEFVNECYDWLKKTEEKEIA